MLSAFNKPKRSYNKHVFKNFDELQNQHGKSVKVDRSLMNNFLKPYITDLLGHGIKERHYFTKIFKDNKFNRTNLQALIKEMGSVLRLKEVITSTRELNHTNSSEKDILLTYQALHDPSAMYYFIFNYISNKFPEMKNKEQLFYDLSIEINKVHVQASCSRIQGSFQQNKDHDHDSQAQTYSAYYPLESDSNQELTKIDPSQEVLIEVSDDLQCDSFDDYYEEFNSSPDEDDFTF